MTTDNMKNRGTSMRTFTGRTFDVLYPKPSDISLEDIAHHLSQCNRYNGACNWPYSVAQHCILVASILPQSLKLAGLLHDAPEAVLGDIIRPLKNFLGDYRNLEQEYQRIFAERFNLEHDFCEHPLVKKADYLVMASEMDSNLLHWHDIASREKADVTIELLPWRIAKLQYILSACYCVMSHDNEMQLPPKGIFQWYDNLISSEELFQNALELKFESWNPGQSCNTNSCPYLKAEEERNATALTVWHSCLKLMNNPNTIVAA